MTILINRRRCMAMLALAAFAARDVRAATKQVRFVLPYPAGGGADNLGRVLLARASAELGEVFVIENRPGAGGTIGAALVANAAPDGQTFLYDATSHAINPFLYPKLPYVTTNFVPVFLAGRVPNILVTHPSVEANTVAEIIALAKATPGGLDFASSGNGTVQHLALELFQRQAGVKLNHIAYKGGSQALADVAGGHVKFYFSNAAACTSYIQSGTVKAIAHTAEGRLAQFPSLPAIGDTVPGFVIYEWNGVFAPKGTPAQLVLALNKALNTTVADPEIRKRTDFFSALTSPNTPDEFARFLAAEMERWGQLIKSAGIKLG
ncbi:MAG: tripartite tricarboxylate transporter substrate binding protein [Achromobacter sp.]|uniref:tripartite tricarboxylate transporter substrate binding protein n=1 Tax=Achromobacter sp. TaxID=134375 RepID=UPI0012C55D49|nr:tripartite tricarboxylate transporter substrate binding protein [Achromobacter sp.]MPS80420.1 tripartite tricarboxylate transporter substrate binding protein [Achromobacter sp.]